MNADGTWNCARCTFINQASAPVCEMCASPLPWSWSGRDDTPRTLGFRVASQHEMLQAAEPAESAERVQEVFNEIDADGSGFIDQAELKVALRKLGEYLDDEEVKACLAAVDTSGDGKISLAEFTNWFTDDQREASSKPLHQMAILAFRYHDEELAKLAPMLEAIKDTHDSHSVKITVGDYKEGEDNLGFGIEFNSKNLLPDGTEPKGLYGVVEFQSANFPGWRRYWRLASKAALGLPKDLPCVVSFHIADEKTRLVRICAEFQQEETTMEARFGMVANGLIGHSVDVNLGYSLASIAKGDTSPLSLINSQIEIKGAIPDVVRQQMQPVIQMAQQMVRGNPGLTALHQGEANVDLQIAASSVSDNIPPGMIPPTVSDVLKMAAVRGGADRMGAGLAMMAVATKAALMSQPLALHLRLPSHLGLQVSMKHMDLSSLVDLFSIFVDGIPASSE